MKKSIRVSLIIIILLIMSLSLLYYFYLTKEDEPIKRSDYIKEYNYSLDERDSELMKDTFEELKKVLKSKNIDYKEYSLCISKLFVIDLFTLDTRINKYDIPSLEYILDEEKDNFSKNISDTIYKYLEDNTYNDRTSELPIVTSIDNYEITDSKYTYKDKEYDGYKINMDISYNKDLGYDNKMEITTITKDNKVYVVKYTSGEEYESAEEKDTEI